MSYSGESCESRELYDLRASMLFSKLKDDVRFEMKLVTHPVTCSRKR